MDGEENLIEQFQHDETMSDIPISESDLRRITNWMMKKYVELPPVSNEATAHRQRVEEQYSPAEKTQISDWWLIRQSPDCPIALIRLIHSKGVEEATFITESRQEHIVPTATIAAGTDEQLCGIMNAMSTPKKKGDFGIGWLVSVALKIRAFDLHKRGLKLDSSQSEARIVAAYDEASSNALESKLREKSSRQLITLVNRALQCTYAVSPSDFFGIILLAYMGMNKKMLSSMTDGAMNIFIDLFTKPLVSVQEMLPPVLAGSDAWRHTYTPMIDSIVFSLIPMLRDIHNRSMNNNFDGHPEELKRLLPRPSGGSSFSTLLQLPKLDLYGRLQHLTSTDHQTVRVASDELIDDRYIALHNQKGQSASVQEFEGEIRIRNGKSKLSLDWQVQRAEAWKRTLHARNYHALAVFLKVCNNLAMENAIYDLIQNSGDIIAREDLDEKDFDVREQSTKVLCVAQLEGDVGYGQDFVPIPNRSSWPYDLNAWTDLSPRYQACFRFFSPDASKTAEDELRIDQGTVLIQQKYASLLVEDDRDPALQVRVMAFVDKIELSEGKNNEVKKSFCDLYHLQDYPQERFTNEDENNSDNEE